MAGWNDQKIKDVFTEFEWFFEAFPSAPEDRWIIEWVATTKEHRRRGIFTKLLKEMFKIGKEKGYTKSQIAVFIGNDPAHKAYEKNGFVINKEGTVLKERFKEKIGNTGMYQLWRDI